MANALSTAPVGTNALPVEFDGASSNLPVVREVQVVQEPTVVPDVAQSSENASHNDVQPSLPASDVQPSLQASEAPPSSLALSFHSSTTPRSNILQESPRSPRQFPQRSPSPLGATVATLSSAISGANLQHTHGSDFVFGVPLTSNIPKETKRVLVMVALCGVLYVLMFIVNMMSGAYNASTKAGAASSTGTLWAAIASLSIALSIPICGYYGAVRSNLHMTCYFCSCNLFLTIVSIMAFFRLIIRNVGDLQGRCDLESDGEQRRMCEWWNGNATMKVVTVIIVVASVAIGCLAFRFGNSLHHALAQNQNRSVPIVGEVISIDQAYASRGPPGLRGTPSIASSLAVLAGSRAAQSESSAGNNGAASMTVSMENGPPSTIAGSVASSEDVSRITPLSHRLQSLASTSEFGSSPPSLHGTVGSSREGDNLRRDLEAPNETDVPTEAGASIAVHASSAPRFYSVCSVVEDRPLQL